MNNKIPLKLSNGETVYVEIEPIDAPSSSDGWEDNVFEEVGLKTYLMGKFTSSLTSITEEIAAAFQNSKSKPDRMTIELGVKLGMKSGKLTTILVQGNADANLRVKLEWGLRIVKMR